MEQETTLAIKGKFLTKEDILRFANLIHRNIKQGNQGDEEEYSVNYGDVCCTSSHSEEVFDTDDFTTKEAYSIRLAYTSLSWEKKLQINLYNSTLKPSSNSVIYIMSTDDEWFNATCNRVKEAIYKIKNQGITMESETTCLLLLIATSFAAYFFAQLLVLLNVSPRKDLVVDSLLWFILLLRFNTWILERLFPPVEFSFGPEKSLSGKRLRKIILTVGAFLIVEITIPFALSRLLKI